VTTVLVVHPRLADLRGAEVERHVPLLRRLGLRLLLADHRPDPAFLPYFERVLELPPAHEVEAGWERLAHFVSAHPVDAVFAQTESGIPYGALLAREFGLRGPRPAALYPCLDKYAGRVQLARADVAQPEFALVSAAEEARRAARACGWPVVLKGCASACQRLVTLVRSEAELAPAVARLTAGLAGSHDIARLEGFARVASLPLACDPRREFLVEEYAAGDPLESDGLIVGSEVRSLGITEQAHSSSPSFFIEGYLSPADRPPEELARLEAQTRAALAALGLTDTGYSIEFRSTAQESRLIEVNGRLGCDEGFGDLFEAVLGSQPNLLAFLLAIGAEVPHARPRTRAAVAYRSCYRAGRILRVPSDEELSRLGAQGLLARRNVPAGAGTLDAAHPDCHPHLGFVLARDESSSRGAFARAQRAAQALAFDHEPARSAHPVG
jgi:biotin carboxylase